MGRCHTCAADGSYARDEDEQATYVGELLEIVNTEGVDTAFVHTFARYDPNRADPHEDLDIASFGVVKVFEHRRGRVCPIWPGNPKSHLPR